MAKLTKRQKAIAEKVDPAKYILSLMQLLCWVNCPPLSSKNL